MQWHEWFGQFRSTVDSAPLSPDVKLTYLKTLVTGKAKLAIANFAYCGSLYPQALKTLERKFGQPQAVVGAHLDRLSNYPAVKMHSSETIVSYASVITSLVSVFQSLCYDSDLRSASLLNQAVSKLPPNLKEGWSLHTLKRDLRRPTLLDFDTWLQEKAEAHERMRAISKKASFEESPPISLKKTTSKVFAYNTAHQKSTKVGVASETKKAFPPCVVCKGNLASGNAQFLKRRRRLSEQKCWRRTNYVFPALMLTTDSATVRILESALKTVAIAAIILSCMAQTACSPANSATRCQCALILAPMLPTLFRSFRKPKNPQVSQP